MRIFRTGNESIINMGVLQYFVCPAKVVKADKSSVKNDPGALFVEKPDFSVFFNTFQYKMTQNQTDRFPHLFHKVPVANFLHRTFYWPPGHMVKICKGVLFIDIKVTR